MNKENHELFHKLMFIFEQLAEPKFEAGAIEHGGMLTDMTDEQLEMHELEELIDMVVYRMTRILKRNVSPTAD